MNWLPDRPWLRTLALAGTVVAAVFLLWQSDEPPVLNEDVAALRGDAEPDGFVIDGQYTSFDASGNLNIRFSSPRIEQFEEGNLATMEAPRAELYGGGAPRPWIVEADNGSLLQNQNLVYLTDNVRIQRTIGEREATLTTSTLTLDNDRGLVYTDAPIEIRDVTGITRATGMKAWINERILELNSQVEGRYETGN
ncbi:LPS export ABC transporter periplasmic protein LptC [Marinobacter sp. F3R08]|uniref:LPS export ABC transporter periplasmic protein LptC n=1 Tax=Marinobacter sp. F3R08 TaxID=2841559 RepID=UPI001C09E0AA|nr:LPS export ABC transporter periplasmic protein LptC [Marinobacter sp. F3R08]MBU2954515.1 LPS export ABC transporter periplasmic protein LptC [Marinobacter sp. F3R08]